MPSEVGRVAISPLGIVSLCDDNTGARAILSIWKKWETVMRVNTHRLALPLRAVFHDLPTSSCVDSPSGRTPLSGDRAQPRFLFLESQKSKIGRRGIASYTLGQAWNRKRGSQFLQPIFFDFGKQIRRDFVGENLPQTPSMIG